MSNNNKYRLLDENMEIDGRQVFRIKALQSFNDVKEGDLGGFVEKEDNLAASADDLSWVYDNSIVYGESSVYDSSFVDGDSVVNSSDVFGESRISHGSKVDNSRIESSDIANSIVDKGLLFHSQATHEVEISNSELNFSSVENHSEIKDSFVNHSTLVNSSDVKSSKLFDSNLDNELVVDDSLFRHQSHGSFQEDIDALTEWEKSLGNDQELN